MKSPPFPQARIGGETVEDTNQGESYRVAEFSVEATVPRINEVVAQ